jgi:purine nucleosidase
MGEPLIIDCDPGQDDAVALLFAAASPELDLLAVTTVAGNVPLAYTSANAVRVLELAGATEVPVYAGCDRPLVREPVTAEYVHGETGLDGAGLPPPARELAPGHAVDRIVELLRGWPEGSPQGAVTLCPIGPLTNIATALQKAPDIAPKIRRIVLMGGAMGQGNVTPSAEFNIFADPHAADVVFRSGVPIVMHGLDVTHQALVTRERLQAIAAIDSAVSRAVVGMLEFYGTRPLARGEGMPLHDPCAVAYLVRPELFEGRDCHVVVETEGRHTLGRTVVDWRGERGTEPNATVITGIEDEAFFALLLERLAALPV